MKNTLRIAAFNVSKRTFDIAASATALITLAPLMLVVGTTIAIRLGRPVLFRQQRPGRNGQIFEMIKFRTMLNPDPLRGVVTNEQRMTGLGSKLRAWSLDELPSLWNVFVGDMSLVGPRPLLTSYLPLYSGTQGRRHEVRPGLTGLAQVNGRNALDWEARFDLDVQYVDNRSWRLDIHILALTVKKVLQKDGISTAGFAVGAPFQGSGASE